MSEAMKDSIRALNAGKAIIDGRDPLSDYGKILVTTEHAIAAILLTCMGSDPAKAVAMLNEGLVQGIEERIALYSAKQRGRS